MDTKYAVAIFLLMLITGADGLGAQTHFTFTSNTGSNATIGITSSTNPNIAGVPLASGDEIGVFSPAGLCVGACVWAGVPTNITVWANNILTPATDGMNGGQVMHYHIWDASAGLEYPYVDAAYSMGDNIFQPNGIYVLSSLSASGALPVELASFSAAQAANAILLAWNTASEVNNYGFEIERSASCAQEWRKIGFVEGAGTTNAPRSYSFADRTAIGGRTYEYRLKQIDRDGNFSYSQTAESAAARMPAEFGLLQNFPNPFNPSTVIGFDLPCEGFTRLNVYDLLGRHAASLVDAVMPAGHHSIAFDASGLSGGMYLCRLEAGTFSQVRMMMLIK